MTTGYTDDLDTEYEDSYDGELYDEGGYDEESAASRARKRRARALAARRRAAARRPSAARLPATAAPRQVVSAVKELDLQNQVQQDTLQSAIATQNRKLERANYATVATLLIGEAFRTFGTPDNNFVRAGIQASPLLVLSSGRSRPGIEGVLRHPAFAGGLGVLGLAFIGDQRQKNDAVQSVSILGPTQLAVGKTDLFVADVLDTKGKPSTVAPGWESSDPAKAAVDATSGAVVAHAVGVTVITARAGEAVRRVRLEVVAAPGTIK